MIKYLSLFSGIGAFEKALQRLGVEWELTNYCEIDKYASKSYSAIFGVPEDKNLGDITKVDATKLPKDLDLISYGFPCQDISNAGRQKGLFNADGSHTRSGLFFEALRIIEETKPRVAIAENVKALLSKKFKEQFAIVLDSLEQAGYVNHVVLMNASDFGVPQNRERVFIVSIRKDCDTGFQAPEGFPLKLRLKDVLEKEVDEKYYLSNAKIQKINTSKFNREAKRVQGDICDTLLARDYKDPKCVIEVIRTTKDGETNVSHINEETPDQKDSAVKLGNVYSDRFDGGGDFGGNVWDTNGIAPTLKTSAAASQQFIIEPPEEEPKVEVLGNYMPSGHEASRIVSADGIAPTVKENHGTVTAVAIRGRYAEDGTVEQQVEISDREVANAVTTVQKDSMVCITEPNVLVQKRTEYGKQIRKAYESGEVSEKWGNMKETVPREDGIANTLTSVLKDNLVIEPVNPMPDGTCRTIKEQYSFTAIANTTRTGSMGATMVAEKVSDDIDQDESEQIYKVNDNEVNFIGKQNKERRYPMNLPDGTYRIRKLTPKECWRLMDFSDEDFEKAKAVNSNTQLYKQAGNSIVVSCPYFILKNLQRAGIL